MISITRFHAWLHGTVVQGNLSSRNVCPRDIFPRDKGQLTKETLVKGNIGQRKHWFKETISPRIF